MAMADALIFAGIMLAAARIDCCICSSVASCGLGDNNKEIMPPRGERVFHHLTEREIVETGRTAGETCEFSLPIGHPLSTQMRSGCRQ